MVARAVVLHWSGEGREVLGLGAALVGVSWADYPSAAEAQNSASVVLRGLCNIAGYRSGGNGVITKGVGESFREVEVFVVDESGKEVRS